MMRPSHARDGLATLRERVLPVLRREGEASAARVAKALGEPWASVRSALLENVAAGTVRKSRLDGRQQLYALVRA